MMFLVDSNVLIEAKNRYYGFDFHPGFWSWLERAHNNGLIVSLEAVARELRRGHDELAQWATAHPLFFEALTRKHPCTGHICNRCRNIERRMLWRSLFPLVGYDDTFLIGRRVRPCRSC